MIKFADPDWIYGFIFLLFLVFFIQWSFKKQQRLQARFAQNDLWPYLIVSLNTKKRRAKLILLLSFLVLAFFSLMRPQWGFQWREIPKQGVSFLMALDVSKSMLSQDIKPSRLERAKLAIGDLVNKLKGDRIGLIIFTNRAYLQCPLTTDYFGFLLTLRDVKPNSMPRGGTSIASAIREAIDIYKDASGREKSLIIITDGENHEGDPLKIAQEAKKAGIVIYCIGIGTSEGDLIPATDNDGKRVFLKDRSGNVIKSRLNETLLKDIALTTGGGYIRASAVDFGLLKIYDEKISKLEKNEPKNKKIKIYEERFQIFLAIALICLILESFTEEKIK